MKTFDKASFEAKLNDYLGGEQPEEAWQAFEANLLGAASGLPVTQRNLLIGLREDERHLRLDRAILAGYKSDAPDRATLRMMVGRWQRTKTRKRALNLARVGLGFGAGLACLLLLVSLLFSLDGLQMQPTTAQNIAGAIGATPTPIPPASMVMPVKGNYTVITKFGDELWYGKSAGLEIGASYGTQIVAAEDGLVVEAGKLNDAAGNGVVIQHSDNLRTSYYHLASVDVKAGEAVVKGEKIGVVGTTGDSVGIHLTFQVQKNGAYIDPMRYLQK